MNLASIIVVAILLVCFFFFTSLPFGVEREEAETGDFSDIRTPRLWQKLLFAVIMSAVVTCGFYFGHEAGYFDTLLDYKNS